MKADLASAIYYALRVLKPVIKGSTKYVEVKEEAEKKYVYDVQKALSDRVWNTGCNGVGIPVNRWSWLTWGKVVRECEQLELVNLSLEPKPFLVQMCLPGLVRLDYPGMSICPTCRCK